jgi:N6-adenosine-specific RNA methylase IME4
MALRLLPTWGLTYLCTFVWPKPGGFQSFNRPQYNAEFALCARQGSPLFTTFKDFNVCFTAPRGKHREKPEAFYSLVRDHTVGRRLDLFARRKIEGFEGWGQEYDVLAS